MPTCKSKLLPLTLLLWANLAFGCAPIDGSEFPLDRQKWLVSEEEYQQDKKCWGGVGLAKQGLWVPVELAIERGSKFTKIGIASRTCELRSIVDFEIDATKVPDYWPFERHAERVRFVVLELDDPDGIFASDDLRTSASSVHVIYSDAVFFLDAQIMLGPPKKAMGGGPDLLNVVAVKRK